MREDLSGLSQAPSGPKRPPRGGEPLDLVAMAEDLKGARAPSAVAEEETPPEETTAGRAKRFGRAFLPAAAGTAALGLTGPAGPLIGATQLLDVPGSPLAQTFPTSRGAPPVAGFGRSAPVAMPGAPPPELSVMPMVRGVLARQPEAFGELAGMVAGGAIAGEGFRVPPGRELVRGAAEVPGAADAFRTLGLDPRTATEADVTGAFHEAAQRTHPDVAPADRTARGGPADPLVAAQQFARAEAARTTALQAIRRGRSQEAPAAAQPGTEEVQYRAQQTKAQAPAPGATPAAPRGGLQPTMTERVSRMPQEELEAQPMGKTPPFAASAAARPGVPEPLPTDIIERERRRTATPVEVERRGVAAPPQAAAAATAAPAAAPAPGAQMPPIARSGAPQEAAHPALAPEARIAYEAPAGDPLKAQKESLAARIAGDGPSFAPIARMRQQGATDTQIAAHIASKGVRNAPQWVGLARTMFKIPQPGGAPTVEMPAERSAAALPEREARTVPEAGAAHDQAAIQEALPGIGEKKLAGKEQAELMPETAGQPTAKLKPTKIAPEEVRRVKREGAEPAGARPMELAPEERPVPVRGTPGMEAAAREIEHEVATPRGRSKPTKQLTPDEQVARHEKLSAQIAREQQVMGAGTHQTTFTDVGGHIGQPGQKFTRTVSKGPAYAALGRLRQAERRLKNLEAEMTPETLARAKKGSEVSAQQAATEANERLAQGGKLKSELEREGIQREGVTPPEVYQELAREQQSAIPPELQRRLIDKLIEYGETREELEKRPPLSLANLALERGVLSPAEESRLLDAIWPESGRVHIPRSREPVGIVPPERGLRDAFRRALYPEKRGPEAAKEARLLRRAIGELRRAIAVDREMLKDARKLPGVDLRTPEGIEWYDRSERPEHERALGGLPPEMRRVTELIRSMYAPLVRESQALGKISEPIENYLAHGWLRPEDAEKARAAMYEGQSKRPFAGSRAFLKQRSWPLLVDGLKAGAKPITPNGVDLNLWKMQQMRKFIFAEQHLRGAEGEGLAMRPDAGERLPTGWRRLQDRTLQAWAMPEPAARILDNYLSSGLRGNEIVDAYLGAANSLVMAKLGLSAFHAAFSTYTGTISRVALAFREARGGRFPLRAPTVGGTIGATVGAIAGSVGGPAGALLGGMMGSTAGRLLQKGLALRASYLKPGMGLQLEQQLAGLLARGGGQHQMPEMYLTATTDAVQQAARRGNLPAAVAKSLLLGLRLTAWPTMQFYVPLIKLGAFSDIMQSEIGRLGPLASEAEVDQAAQATWHSIDNRFGQVSYDTRFWNNAVKHALMGTIQAVGWDAGTIDELGGGVRDALKGKGSHRFDFLVALPLTVALVNILLQYALTGEGPSSIQDLFEPRDGTFDELGNANRMTPATYMKDVLGFARHPIRTALGKLNPILGFIQGAITNRDFYGNKWRNENDPLAQQLKQTLEYLRKEFQPISFSNIEEAKRRGVTGARRALPMVGVTPASRAAIRTPAQNMIFDIMRSHAPARTPEELERGETKRETGPHLSADQRLLQAFRHLAPEDRMRVFGVANEHERALFGPYVARHQRPYKR